MTDINDIRPHFGHAFKRLLVCACAALLLALIGCGGGGGGGSVAEALPPKENPPPPAEEAFDCSGQGPVENEVPIDVMPSGTFSGTFVDCVTGDEIPVIAMVGAEGVFRVISYDEEGKVRNLLTGSLQPNGGPFQGSGRWFNEPGVGTGFALDNLMDKGESLEGRWSNEWGSYGIFRLTYESSATTSVISIDKQLYLIGRGGEGNENDVSWTIASDGRINGKDSIGCVYTGQLDIRVPLYEVQFTVAGCALAGSYSGFAGFGEGPWSPVLVFWVDDGEGRVFDLYFDDPAKATPVGAPMQYTSSTVISGAVDGTGSGGGTAVFDSSGLLTIESYWDTSIPELGATATRHDTTLLYGTITGTVWTSTGVGVAIIHDCVGVGPPVICTGTYPSTTVLTPPGASTLDIYSGGEWTFGPCGPVCLAISDKLTPLDAPLPGSK